MRQLFPANCIACVLSLMSAMPALADTPPPCQTSTGTPGQVFSGMFTLVIAPAEFTTVAVDGGQVAVIAGGFADRTVIVAGITSAGGPTADGAQDHLRFQDAAGATVQSCSLKALVFDPAQHAQSVLSAGDCALRQTSGLPDLRPGHLAVIELPADMLDHAVMPRNVLDISALSIRETLLQGRSAGVATFLWINEESRASVCPLKVMPQEPEAGIDPLELCRDATGREVVLSVGDSATLTTYSTPSSGWAGNNVRVGDVEIAELSEVDEAARIVTVVAKAPGATSVLMRHAEGEAAQVCEVIVR